MIEINSLEILYSPIVYELSIKLKYVYIFQKKKMKIQ